MDSNTINSEEIRREGRSYTRWTDLSSSTAATSGVGRQPIIVTRDNPPITSISAVSSRTVHILNAWSSVKVVNEEVGRYAAWLFYYMAQLSCMGFVHLEVLKREIVLSRIDSWGEFYLTVGRFWLEMLHKESNTDEQDRKDRLANESLHIPFGVQKPLDKECLETLPVKRESSSEPS